MRCSEILLEANVKLSDLYDERELNDEREVLYQYVDEEDLTRDFAVKEMTPEQAKTYVTANHLDMSMEEAFRRFATKSQNRLVREKAKHYDDSRIIVVINNTLLDGNHHMMAAILAKRSIKYIDLADYGVKSL